MMRAPDRLTPESLARLRWAAEHRIDEHDSTLRMLGRRCDYARARERQAYRRLMDRAFLGRCIERATRAHWGASVRASNAIADYAHAVHAGVRP